MGAHLVDDLVRFLHGLGGVSAVLHQDGGHPGGDLGQRTTCGRGGRVQLGLVAQRRDLGTQLRVHAPRIGQEVAKLLGQGGMPGAEPAQRGLVHRLRVGTLGDLGQLLRVSQQEQPGGGAGDRQGVGQGILPGLVNDQQVQGALGDPLAGHGPGGAADQCALIRVQQFLNRVIGGAGPRDLGLVPGLQLLGDLLRMHPGTGDGLGEHVVHHRVGLGHHTDLPALFHQGRNDVGCHVRLAGARGSLDGQVGMVQVAQRRDDGAHDVGVPVEKVRHRRG